jgi:single-strand DNA-binding protein
MSDLNRVTLIGRLARDGELKYTNGGTAVLNFSIAVGKSIPPKDGGTEWKTQTSFFDAVLFGQTAERKKGMMTKGRQVAIDGELQQDKWEHEGTMHYRVKVICSSIQILALPKGQEERGPQASAEGAPAQGAGADFEDDIPF